MENTLTDHGLILIIALHIGLIATFFFLHVVFLKHHLISESRIFLFHVVIFLFLPMLSLSGAITLGWQFLPLDVLTLYGLSALYSLSFLELWSLSEGSYSFQILVAINSGSPTDVLKEASAVGQKKQTDRISGIVHLGLACSSGNRLVITGKGRLVAIIAGLFAGAAGVRQRE